MYTTAIVLAGGKSSRMGADKLRLRVAENSSLTVLNHVVQVCTHIADRVFVAAGQHALHLPHRNLEKVQRGQHDASAAELAEAPGLGASVRGDRTTLPDGMTLPHRVTYVHDTAAFRGPLQALSDVWMKLIDECSREEGEEEACVVLAAGDLPGLHETVLNRCREVLMASPPEVDAVLVTREERWQPLIGCYKLRCGLTLSEVAQAGEERIMRALDALHIHPVSAENAGWPDWWTRPIHTPSEYQEWLNRHLVCNQEEI